VLVLLDAGFDMTVGISPLSVFILTSRDRSDVTQTPSPASQFIDFVIEHGAHVGQQRLTPRESNVKLEALRVQLHLPDALHCALQSGELSYIT
jgi:hypothetical protein